MSTHPRLRRRLAVASAVSLGALAASVGLAVAGSVAAPRLTVTPAIVAPSANISYIVDNATCVPLGTGAGVFTWNLRSGGPTGTVVQGPFVVNNNNFTAGGNLTSAPFAAPATPGTYTITLDGINNCQGTNLFAGFEVQAPTTTAAPTTAAPTTAAPTTAAPTTAAPTTAAPTTAAPTTTTGVGAGPSLPDTGADLSMAVIAMLLLAGGTGLVVATRRR